MAGDIKRQRKSWTLQDRSKVSINILRANLAEEGDEDAQLDIARRLLEESAGIEVPEHTKNENARLALYWLIKSSEQGNDEATQLLQECLLSGQGLTAQNILDVRTCVTTPKYEKLTFKAARLLHQKLSNGEEFITTTQLLARVNVNRKNVTFEERSNRDVIHEEMLEDDSEHHRVQEVDEEKEENSMDSGTGGSTPEQNEPPPPTPHPLLKDIRLNETFIVSSQKKRTSPSNSPPFLPHSSSTPKESESLLNENRGNASRGKNSRVDPKSLDLKLALIQSGKKLTLQDLLNVAKDFNCGRTSIVSVDERNKVLTRHRWELSALPNMLLLQLVIFAVVGKVIHVKDALTYLILMGMVWSAYNLFMWKLRYENFKDWKQAFQSVLVDESWETENLRQRFSQRYMIPYLVILSIGLVLSSFFNLSSSGDQSGILITAVGILAIISIQSYVLNRIFFTWQQILMLGLTLVYYHSSIVSGLLGEKMIEQTRLLHEPLISVDADSPYNLSLSISTFSVLICTCLSTTLKPTLDQILCQTFPEVVLTLWLIKIVSVSVECEITEFYVGAGVGLIVCCAMAVLTSKMDLWKVITGIVMIAIGGLILIELWCFNNGDALNAGLHQGEMKFLEWEEYDTSCHRKAWSVLSPAATQIKCSSMYDDARNPVLVKWKGRVSLVRVEKLSRSFFSSKVEDVAFDISVGIFTGRDKEDAGSNWQSFLSGSSESGESVAPASVMVQTDAIWNKRKKQNLIDHILNLKSGDKIEFVGRLKGSTAGSLKPQIVNVERIQCISCSTADYEPLIVGDQKSYLEWFREALFDFEKVHDIISDEAVYNYKTMILEFVEKLKSLLLSN